MNNILGYKALRNSPSREDVFNHIMREDLQAPTDSPFNIHLRNENVTTLRRLLQYIRKPGVDRLQWRDSDDTGKMKNFPDDTKKYLRAFPHYLLHWLQNNFGSPQLFCLFTRTHDDFKDYIGIDFNPSIRQPTTPNLPENLTCDVTAKAFGYSDISRYAPGIL